ncbi:hypothetical protein ACF1G5_14760 [Streptomyces coeruleorubidus]|uniref:hypothetical protein n=1 Tax=Streptomyces coeruleorubidus TaxID=116188 RepID=UPI0036F90D8B
MAEATAFGIGSSMGYDSQRPWQQKWRDVINGLNALQATYQQPDLDSDAVRRQVEDFFEVCCELADWLDRQAGKPRAMRYLKQTDPDLRLCDGIAQTRKHHTREGADPITAKISKVYGGQGGVRAEIEWSRPSGAQGTEDALDLAQRCVSAWLRFLKHEGLTP